MSFALLIRAGVLWLFLGGKMKLSKLMLVSTLLLSSALQAQDRIGWGDPRDPRQPSQPGPIREPREPREPRQPTRPSDPWEDHREQESRSEVEMYIGESFFGRSQLNLLRDHYVRMQLEGKRIKEIRITTSTEQGQGRAKVLINGLERERERIIPRQLMEHSFSLDTAADQIGRELRTLELEMQGRFYVEKVVFITHQNNGPIGPGPWNPPGQKVEVLKQQLRETIQGEGGLHLFRMFNLGMERQGEVVRRVTVVARSERGHAQAQLHLNEQSQGMPELIGMGSTRLTFDLAPNMRIGREIQALRLYFRGNVVVEEVSIELEKRSQGGGQIPGPFERRIEEVLNQRIFDTSGVRLVDLMRTAQRHQDRVVESVELVLRHSDFGTRVKLCQELRSHYQSQDCGMISTLSQGMQIVRLTTRDLARLSDVSLSVRMGMIDIERIIVNLR
jgi:hypothetical protein